MYAQHIPVSTRDKVYPAGEEFYIETFIDDTKLVTIDPGKDGEVMELIEILTIE